MNRKELTDLFSEFIKENEENNELCLRDLFIIQELVSREISARVKKLEENQIVECVCCGSPALRDDNMCRDCYNRINKEE